MATPAGEALTKGETMTEVAADDRPAVAGIRLHPDLCWRPAEPWSSRATHVDGVLSTGASVGLALDSDRALPHDVRSLARGSWLHGRVLAYRAASQDAVVLVVPGMVMSLPLMAEALLRHDYGHEDSLAA
jgi:hypothetical protein